MHAYPSPYGNRQHSVDNHCMGGHFYQTADIRPYIPFHSCNTGELGGIYMKHYNAMLHYLIYNCPIDQLYEAIIRLNRLNQKKGILNK
jgi:hypothetical protein